MGSSHSRALAPYIDDWVALTYLKKADIISCYNRFRGINEDGIDQDPVGFRVPDLTIIETFPELTSNPFNRRLCKVFSSRNDEMLSFEDFLDMMSVLSEDAPPELKAEWAFKVFDFNDDDKIDGNDIETLIGLITGNAEDLRPEIGDISRRVIKEADVKDGIALEDFRNLLSKSPDFYHNFTLRL